MVNKKISYRPEIDGLRAVAVISVLIFHLNPEILPGGFLGVDIFFTISGFLITSIIYDDILKGHFSFKNFFRKRILRLVPPSVFVVFATIFCGFYLLGPSSLYLLIKSAISSLAMSANIFFWKILGLNYFAPESETLPLLHFWSLAIEEQFYFFWPPVLFILSKYFNKRIFLYAFLLIFLSVALSFVLTSQNSELAYFMPFTRAYQLLIGCLVGIYSVQKGKIYINDVLLDLVFLILVSSFFWMNKTFSFPGLWALIPTLLTSILLIANEGRSISTRFLKFKSVVFIGLTSYSLYLWHWPVISLFKIKFGEVKNIQYIIVLFIIIILTLFSYYFIEKKTRYIDISFNKSLLFNVVPLLIVVLFLFPSIKAKNLNFISKNKNLTYGVDRYTSDATVCHDLSKISNNDCVYPKGDNPDVLMWGDSNSAHYVGFVKKISLREGKAFRNISESACAPLLSRLEEIVKNKDLSRCKKFATAIEMIKDKYPVHIISGQWATYYKSPGFEQSLRETFKRFKDKKVYIMSQIPFLKIDRDCEISRLIGENIKCKTTNKSYASYIRSHSYLANLLVKSVVKDFKNISFVDLTNYFCDKKVCSVFNDKILKGIPLYYDRSHLNNFGSAALGESFVKTKVFFK